MKERREKKEEQGAHVKFVGKLSKVCTAWPRSASCSTVSVFPVLGSFSCYLICISLKAITSCPTPDGFLDSLSPLAAPFYRVDNSSEI